MKTKSLKLALVVAICMFALSVLALFAPVAFAAEGDVATVQGVGSYATLQEAVAAAENGTYNKVILESDVQLSETLEISGSVVLDLNGKKVTASASWASGDSMVAVKRGGNLVIMDEVGGGQINTGENASIYASVKLTVKGEDDATQKASLTVNGGELVGYYYGIVGNGGRHNTSVLVDGGKIVALHGTGIFNPQNGTVTISGDAYVQGETGIEMRAGTLLVNGGTIVATGKYEVSANGSGTTVTGAAIAVSQHLTNQPVVATVTGGKLYGEKALCEVDTANDGQTDVTLAVKGGLFEGEVYSQNETAFITGGEFVGTMDATYVGSTASVLLYNAKIGTTYYPTFAEAYEAATEGQTIVLFNTLALDVATTFTKTVTIDLNGNTLDINAAALYVLEGHLTIANGKIDVSGVVANGDCIIGVGNYSKDGALTLNNVEVFGDGYSSAYAVFYVYGESDLYLNGCKVSLSNDTASAGGAFKSETATGATIVFTESEVSLKDAKIGFLNGTVTFESSTLTIEGGKNAINGSVLTISNSQVEIFGSPERGITVTNGAVTIINSTVDVHDMAEADIRFKSNDEIKVEDNSTLKADNVVVDKYEEKSVADLIVADATATVPTFEVVVDGVAYKTVAEGLAQIKAGSFVELLTDYTTDATMVINGAFTLVGNDHTFTSSARKAFEIHNATDSDINVVFSNVNIVNTYTATNDGRCIDTRNDHINLTITNCTLTTTNVNAGSQPLTIGGSDQEGVNVVLTGTTIVAGNETAGNYGYAIITFVKTNFTIDNCDVTGYAALYVNQNDASGTTATITNSRLNGINNYQDVADNSFGAIVVHATNVTVNVSGTQVTLTEGLQNAVYKLVGYYETHSPLANNKVTVANDVTVNGQPVQNQVLAGFEVKSQAGTTYYTSFDQALANAVDGDQILLGKDVVLDTETVISKNVTVDFNGNKMTLTGTPLKIAANVTFKNGTLDITGCVNTALHLVYVGVGSTPGTLNLEEIDVVGNGYQTDYSIFFMGNKGTLNLTKCTVNVSEDASSRGGVFKADGGTSEATLNITESTLNFKNADIGFLNAVVTLTDSKLTIEGGRNAINGSALTIVRSEVEIFGSNERGITLDRGDVVIVDSKVDIHDMAEASIRFKKDFDLQVKGTSEVSVETIVIDDSTNATYEQLVTVEDTATFTKFVVKVDEVCYTSLDAIGPNVADGSVIVLLADVTVDQTFAIYNYNLTIDGNGHTFTSTAPINFEIYNQNATTMNVTFKNVTLVNASGIVNNSRVIVVKSDNVALNVTDSTVTSATANCALIHVSAGAAANVAVNVTGSTLTAGSDAGYGYALYLSSATTLNVTDTTVTAWAALYASQSDGSNSVVTFTQSTINSVNVHSGATNSFGALVVYADNVEVTLNKTAVNVTAASAPQYFVLFGMVDVFEATNSKVVANESTVTGATALTNTGVQVTTATGYVYYTSLADVVAQDGETVTLLGDTNTAFVVSNGTSVTLDLNGYTLTNANGVTATGAGSKLTVVDSSADKSGTISGRYAVNALDGGAVVIKQANVVSTMYAIYVNDGSVVMDGGYVTSQLGYGVVLFGSDAAGASFTLNDGVIEGSVGLTATGDNQYDNCAVTINGGAITAGNDQIAVYWASNGLLKVTGGTITGATAVYVKSGSVDITGGTFVATGAQYTYRYVANGAVATGDALVIENVTQDSYEGIVAAAVTAGHFVSANAKPIATYAYVAGEEVVNFVQVGVTSNKALAQNVVAVGFISNPTTDAEGNAVYAVEKDRVAQVGNVVYGTVEEAIAAAIESGETLVMLKNADIGDQTVVVPAGKTFTIDLNGFVLSGSTDQRNHTMIINNGTFVVEDNSALSDGEIRYTFTGEGDASFGTGNYTVSNRGNMTVNSGTVNNATGAMTHMRDAIDNNSTVRDAILVINGGEVKCDSYMAIRQFANSTTHKNDVVINGGKVGKIFVQGPNSNENLATLTVAGGEVTGLFVSFEGDTTNLEFDIKASCLTSDYLHFYVDDNHYVYEDKVADRFVVLEKSQVAKVGEGYYTFAQAIAKSAETGEEAILIVDATFDTKIEFKYDAAVVVNLNGKTLKVAGNAMRIKSDLTFKNGTIDVTGAVGVEQAYFIVYVGATLTFDQVNLVGDGYSTNYGVFYVDGTITFNKSTINLKNDLTGGGVFKADQATAQINLVDSEVSFKDAGIGFTNAVLNVTNTNLTIEGGKNAINGCTLTITDSEVEIFGSNERGITVTHGPVTIINSTVDVHDMAEADIRFKNNNAITVEGNSTLKAESVVIDKYEEKSIKELIVADATATVPTFEVVVDGVAYKTVAEGLAQIKAGSFVELLTDYTTDATMVINGAFTLVGNDHTFTSSARKAFEIHNATDSDINVVFSNVNIVNTYTATNDGRCIDTRNDHINLTITNCTLTTTNVNAGSQPLTIGGSDQEGVNVVLTGTTIVAGNETAGNYGYAIITFVKTNFTIDNCDVTGYAALYVNQNDASGTTATITNSRLNGINNYQDVADNSFGAIVVHATNVTVNVSGTQVTLTEGLQNAVYKLVGYYETHSPLANNKVTVANDVTVNGQPVQNQVLAGFEVKSQAGTTYYTSFDQALANAVDGDQINFGRDVVLDADTVISKNVTVDLNGFEMVLTGAQFAVTGDVTITNGTIDVTNAVAQRQALIFVGNKAGGTLTLNKVNFVGSNYSPNYGVFFVESAGTLNVVESTITLSDDQTTGGVFKSDYTTSVINFVDSTITLKNAGIAFLNAQVNLTNSKLTIEGGRNAINGSILTITNSEVEIFGSNERGITVTNGPVTIIDSVVNIHDMAEASIRFKSDDLLQVQGNSTLTAETIVIDAATGATFQDLVVVEPTATMSEFVITVDEVSYTNAMQALAAVKANSVITLFSGYDFTLPTALTFNCDVTVNGNGNVVYTTNSQTVVVDGAKVTFNNVTIQNAGTAFYVKANSSVVVNACQIDAAFLVAFDGTGSTLVMDGQTVSAANDEVAVKAQVEGKTVYASDLATLVAYLGDTYTQVEITLYADQILTETQIVVASGATYVINLNGKTVSGQGTVAGVSMITNNGTLNIVGEGTITYEYVGAPDTSYGKGNSTISNCGKLTVTNATIKNTSAKMSHAMYTIDNNSSARSAEATIVDSTIIGTNNIAIRFFANSTTAENVVTIKGSKTYVVANSAYAIQIMLPSSNVDQAPKATLNVEDGKIENLTDGYFAVSTYSAGNSFAATTINISGGEFIGYVCVGYSAKAVYTTETLNVTGGVFSTYTIYSYADETVVTTNNYNVTAGHYKYAPSDIVVAEGHVIAQNADNTYNVVTYLVYVQDYVSEDAKVALKEYMQNLVTNGSYSATGVANLEEMYQDACAKLDLATTIEQVETIVAEAKVVFGYVVNKWDEAILQSQAVLTLKQYAASNGLLVSEIPQAAFDAIAQSASQFKVNAALVEGMQAIDQVVEAKLQAAFDAKVQNAVAQVQSYADRIGLPVDTAVILAATTDEQLEAAVNAAINAVDLAFDEYKQLAVDSLYGNNNQFAAHVTTAMVASIYAAETVEEVEVALGFAETEIAQIKEYKNKINQTYTAVQTAVDSANNAATKATEAAQAATDAAAKAEAAGISAAAALDAATNAANAAQLAKVTADEAKAAAEAAKAAAESGKATAEQLAQAVAAAQTAIKAAEDAAKAAEEAAKKAAQVAADKTQSAEVKLYADETTAQLQAWITDYLDALAKMGPVASNSTTNATFRAQLATQIASLYTEDNQALILSYYDQAMSAIALATTKEQVDNVFAEFKANVALVDVLQNFGSTLPQYDDSNVRNWLVAVAAVEALLAIAVLCLLFKKKTTVTVELPIEEPAVQPAATTETAPVAQEATEEAVEEEAAEAEEVAEEVVEEVEEATEEAEEAEEVAEEAEEAEESDDDDDDDDEGEAAPAVEGEADPFASLQNRQSKTFDERLAEADEETQLNYQQIQQAFLCYKKVKERKSKKFASFRKGRTLLAKVVLRGKSFNVFLALNPDEYPETVYHQKNKGDKKAYELVPMMVRVRSPRSLQKLKRLIDIMLEGEEKVEVVAVEQPTTEVLPVAPAVVDDGEDKEVYDDGVEQAAEEATEAQGEVDPFADLQNRKSKTFDERLAEAEEQTRATYEEIKAAFLAHKKVKERQSKKFVSFRKGRTLLAKVVLRGKSFNVFLALNPDEYAETVYHHKAKGDKKAYELVPMMVRVRSPRSVKKVKRLIDDVVAKANAPQA